MLLKFEFLLGASGLSVNAPEFVPGGGAVMIPQSNFIHNNQVDYAGTPQQQQQAFNLRLIQQQQQQQLQQQQQSFPPFTPYTTQQPHPEIQSFAMHPNGPRMSISDRLTQFHISGGPQPHVQQMQPQHMHHQPQHHGAPQMNGSGPGNMMHHHHHAGGGGGGPTARINNIRNGPMHGGYNNHRQQQNDRRNNQNDFEEAHQPVSFKCFMKCETIFE